MDRPITYTLADIERYLNGGMSAIEMYDLEKAALQDPFLADAMEGYTNTSMPVAKEHLATIEEKILGNAKEDGKVVPMPVQRSNWLRIAASVLLLFAVGSGIWLVSKKKNDTTSLASNSTEQKIAPSTTTVLSAPKQNDSTVAIAQVNNGKEKKENNSLSLKNNDVAAFHKEENIAKIKDEVAKVEAARIAPKDNYNYNISALKKADTNLLVQNNKFKSASLDQKPTATAEEALTGRIAGVSITQNSNGYTNQQNQNLNKAFLYSTDDPKIFNHNNDSTTAAYLRDSTKLDNDKSSLSDVVVMGYGTAKKRTVTRSVTRSVSNISVKTEKTAIPVGGWESFYTYVEKKKNELVDSITNNESSVEVTLKFSIDANGKPFNISVIKHATDELDAKAIEILQDGPAWIAQQKSRKTKVVIKF
jgi:hypothetical protein